MNRMDKIYLGALGLGILVIAFAAWEVNKIVNRPDIQASIDDVAGVVHKVASFGADTVRSAEAINTAVVTGNAPPANQSQTDSGAVHYLESVHDLVVHPVDSVKVLWNGWFGN